MTKQLSYKSLLTLKDQKWLDDDIMDLIIEEIINKSSYKEKTHIMSCTFYQMLLSGSHKISRYRRIMNIVIKCFKGIKLFEKRAIIIPTCANAHWAMAIIIIPKNYDNNNNNINTNNFQHTEETKKMKKTIYYLQFNSINNEITRDQTIISSMRIFLKYRLAYESGTDTDIDLIEIRPSLPKQTDNYNCGIYTLHYLERALINLNETFGAIINGDDNFEKDWEFNPNIKREELLGLMIEMNKTKKLKIFANKEEIDELN